jgi:ribosomal protein L9
VRELRLASNFRYLVSALLWNHILSYHGNPAFYNNKLRPTQSAVLISDEEVQKEQVKAAEADKQTRETAERLKELFLSKSIVFKRKAGPDGQLFGGIGAKAIMEELQSTFGEEEFLSRKSVKVTSLLDADGEKIAGDIKHTGKFGATISLTQDLSAKIEIEVEGE